MNSINHEYRKLNSKQITSDPGYQRAIDYSRVKRIVSYFNPALVNPIKVSFRDGKYFVFDGQHTLTALKLKNGNQDLMVECKVYQGLTQSDEAKLFSEQNGISRTVDSNAKMKALFTAGDIDILELHDLVNSLGIKFDFTKNSENNKIVCCKTIFDVYKKTSISDLKDILTIIKESWNGESTSFTREMINGMYLFHKAYKGDYTSDVAIKQFSRVSPKIIIRDGKAVSFGGGVRFARQLLMYYNKNLSKNRLKDIL